MDPKKQKIRASVKQELATEDEARAISAIKLKLNYHFIANELKLMCTTKLVPRLNKIPMWQL